MPPLLARIAGWLFGAFVVLALAAATLAPPLPGAANLTPISAASDRATIDCGVAAPAGEAAAPACCPEGGQGIEPHCAACLIATAPAVGPQASIPERVALAVRPHPGTILRLAGPRVPHGPPRLT